MTSQQPIRRGHIVAVEFYDHVQNAKRPLRCTVYGQVSGTHRNCLVVDSWITHGGEKVAAANVERFTIVRSAILRVRRLVEERTK